MPQRAQLRVAGILKLFILRLVVQPIVLTTENRHMQPAIRSLTLLLLCSLGSRVYAQQNLFNVPSSDITGKNKIFFQQQLNFFPANISSNSTFCLGLGKNYEIGINVLGVTYDIAERKLTTNKPEEKPLYPSYGFNAQKILFQTHQYSISAGTQILFNSAFSKTEWYGYINHKLKLGNAVMLAGIYSGNRNYFGNQTLLSRELKHAGIQAGLEYMLIKDKLFFQADYISGKTVLSNLITGLAYNITPHWILSSGYQMTQNKKDKLPNGTVFEITYVQ